MENPVTAQPTPTKHKPAFSREFEERVIGAIVPHLPRFLNGTNLTLATIGWSAVVVTSAWVGRGNIKTLWIVSALILVQYITDSLDGAVGRFQRSGLVKWGYVMDHFLDTLFSCSVLVAYALIVPSLHVYVIVLLAIISLLMAATFLRAGVTGKFRMSYFRIGPSELRFIVVAQNILTILFGVTLLRYLLIINTVVLFYIMCLAVYRAQHEARRIDKLAT